MRFKFKLLTVVFFVSQTAFMACVNDSKKNSSNDESNLIVFEEENIEEGNLIFYRFPSPEETFKYLKSTNLQYNSEPLNNPLNYKQYIGIKKQAVNLGIYISDLAYITMFEQEEASLDYFLSIHSLCEELKISSAFNKPLIDRISDNMGNSDSLVVIAGDAYKNIVDYLVENEQEDLLSLISSGALFESLFLTIQYIPEYSEDNELLNKIISQRYVVSNITEFAKQQKNSNDIIKDLVNLNSVFSSIKSVETKTTIDETSDNKLIIGGGSTLSISKKDYLKLKKTIQNIRENYIKIQ